MKKVMVAIYNSIIRLPIVKHLKQKRLNFIEAPDFNSASMYLGDSSINCCILNLNLPSIVHGVTLLGRIRKDYPGMEVIIINSNLNGNTFKILKELGITKILETPIDIQELDKAIGV